MQYVQTLDQLQELVDYYSRQDAFTFDVETVGEHRGDPRRNRVTWIALATRGRSDVIPMGHPHGELIRWEYPLKPSGLVRQEKGLPLRKSDYSVDQRKATPVWTEAPEQLTPAEVFRGLESLMFSDLIKVGHNVKFDLESVAKYYRGRVPTGPYFDTMVAAFLINSTQPRLPAPYHFTYALNSVLRREFGYEMEKGVGKEIESHPFSVARKYTLLDGKWTWLLYKELASQLKRDKLEKLMALEMDVLEVLCEMELEGARLDLEDLKNFDTELTDLMEQLKYQAFKAAGREFRMTADNDIRAVLYSYKKDGGQGLRPWRLTKGGMEKQKNGLPLEMKDWSVDKEALASFEGNPVVDALTEFNTAERLQGTYLSTWLKDNINGRIHADFNQIGAETGRFSCRAPNLQNVPNPEVSELGRRTRSLFICDPGEKLVIGDYSQIEPRIMASFSQDPRMMQNYHDGGDIYTTLADPLGLPRKAGKIGILAMGYGVAPPKAASQLKVSIDEARKILDGFEKEFAAVYRYKAYVVRECKKRRPVPYVQTMLGRRRYLPELFSQNPKVKARAERQAFNTMIQGSAADLIKLAMVRLYRMLKDEVPEAKILLQIHDELVVKCPEDKAELTAKVMREAMEDIPVLKVPLVADIKIVDKWSEAK